MKCAFASLGCAKNLVDTENMMGFVKEGGMEIVNDEREADVIVVNTCAFIADAAQESCDRILELAEYRKSGSAKCLIVAGCLTQRYKDELMKEIPEIDGIIGTGEYDKIFQVISDALKGNRRSVLQNVGFLAPDGAARVVSTPKHYAYIKVAEGCSNRCSYCMIPYLRGDYKSKPEKQLLKEAVDLASMGMKEALVIAQDTTRYGEDLYGGRQMLPDLLRKLTKIDGIDWIRMMYAYPTRLTQELIDVMAEEPKILKYLDLPVQHGSNEVLTMMNRKGSAEDILYVVDKMRRQIPNMVVRTTFIVGFPGETDRHIQELLQFIDCLRPERAGVFTYSREDGTPAADFERQVPYEVMEERRDLVMRRLSEISLKYGESRVGSVEEVYVEGPSQESELLVEARSYAEAPDVDGRIYIGDATLKAGDKVKVKITQATEYDLAAEVV